MDRRVGYAFGSVGTGGFGTLPGLVLAYYLTDTLGVAAGLAGLAVTLPKVWDVVIDPFVGRLSDASARRRGTRRSFMLAGALLLPAAFVLLFAVPDGWTGVAAALWVVVAFVLATTAISLFQVPYIALPAELANTPAERTRLVAPRIAVLALAILAFGAGGPAVRDAVGGGRGGYLVMAAVTGLVMGIGMVVSTLATTSRSVPGSEGPLAREVAVAAPVGDGFAALASSSRFRTLLTAFVLQALATGSMLASAQYVATYALGDPTAVTLLFVALVAPALLVMPLARRASQRWGKARAWGMATCLFAIASLALLAVRVAPGPWVYGCVAAAGIAYAGLQLYPLALLPDVIAEDSARHGRDRAGAIAGVWTAAETAGLALGPTVALAILAITGFVSRTDAVASPQPGSALWGVAATFSALPAVLAVLSLWPLTRFTRVQEPSSRHG